MKIFGIVDLELYIGIILELYIGIIRLIVCFYHFIAHLSNYCHYCLQCMFFVRFMIKYLSTHISSSIFCFIL